ncbi:exopolyphosphatase PRUNE1 [Trichonephila inaurata madagascariensis]|uniref:Exopolyphosphatase PRUNE1 n=1 Tax=Trichonephila inaurata madagascariensis TaxID=2747483 RepID=A0A8X6X1I7_9ARAC|nr:exopolyphosphatase PRUNE1 [Trichonephila inaurata madagascariensis]
MEFYLQECKHNLKNASESSKIQIVLGNESCDLDSAISSLVMAYFIFKVQKNADIVVPVLNVKRKELAVRTEVVFFLEETSINISDVICIDEIDLKALHEKGKLSVVLVDHNTLSTEQSYLDSRVVQILDHHEIDNPDKIKKLNSKIEPVGSCCTLVADEILNSNPAIMDPQIAMLLYGTIVLDTICLNETAQRVTEKDRKIVEKLETYLPGVSRNEVFDTLQKVKFDVSKLTPVQLLYKDTKLISDNSTSIALVSFPTLIQDVLQEASFLDALDDMASSKNLNSIIILGLKVAEGQSAVRRQIAVYDRNPSSLEKVIKLLFFFPLELTPVQLLYKDTKLISDNSTSIALVSFPTLIQDVLQEASFLDALDDMASSKNLNSIIILGLKVAEGQSAVRRQIAVYDRNPSSLEKISKYLQKLENPSLALRQLPLCGFPLMLFEQGNIALTRKFVLPAMQNYLKFDQSDSGINHTFEDAEYLELESSKPRLSFVMVWQKTYENEISKNADAVDIYEIEEFPDEIIPTYQAEPVDFPDSPDHSRLLEISVQSPGQVCLISEDDDFELKKDVMVSEGTGTLKRIAVNPKVLESQFIDDDQRSLSSLSNRSDAFSQSEDIILDDDAATIEDLDDNSDCDSDLDSPLSDPIPEMSAAEEFEEERSWKSCTVNGEDRKIDMKVIEPYRKVLSHGGYQGDGNAIIIFSACYLPDRSRKDYEYVMDNLFL